MGVPIENGAFVVESGRISAVGKKGAVTTPAGVERVDLTGKTVMPAMVNAHIHIGYDKLTSWGAQNYGPQNILDHLKREAWADHIELETYVKFGMTASEAIVTATQRSAEFIGIKDVGTLAAGKSDDFLVLDANPLWHREVERCGH